MADSHDRPLGGVAPDGTTAPLAHPPAAPSDAGSNSQRGGTGADGDGLYRLLVETVRDYAIFLLDPTGHILTWNPGAERFKGYKAHEIIGRHFSVFYPEEDIRSGKPPYELEVASEVGRFEDEGWRLRQDGTRFWANVVITALRDKQGTLVGFAKVTRDLTERKEAENRAIADARRIAEADAANRAKSEFLAAMSHELRTPLNAIGGYVDLLLMGIGGEVSGQQRSFLSRIRGSQQHLLGLISDLLNFSRIEAGQIVYEIRPLALSEVIEGAMPMIEPQAILRGLRLERARGTNAIARGDRAKVEQILLNLISNAIKFTEPGGRVTVSSEIRQTPAGARAVISVSDTGVGIPASKHEAIFEPFVQVGRSLTTPQEGTGLGLAISRDMARAMAGEITVESEEGRGSTFELFLPLATDHQQQEEPEPVSMEAR